MIPKEAKFGTKKTMISLNLVSDSEAALSPAERDLGPDE